MDSVFLLAATLTGISAPTCRDRLPRPAHQKSHLADELLSGLTVHISSSAGTRECYNHSIYMKPSPAHRLGYIAGASVLATVLVFALSGPSIVRADAAPPPVPGTFGPAMRFVLSLSHELKSLEMTVAGFAESFTTNELTFTRGTGN
jgi:hypothetical protein